MHSLTLNCLPMKVNCFTGKYCVYKSKNAPCPEDMTSGSVFWDDEDEDHQTQVGEGSPDGSYVNDTTIYYCCQNDGNPYDSIELPVERPFYLLTSNSFATPKCQMVKWAFSSLEYLVLDTENVNNSDSESDDHVFIANKTVYYCYYEGILLFLIMQITKDTPTTAPSRITHTRK